MTEPTWYVRLRGVGTTTEDELLEFFCTLNECEWEEFLDLLLAEEPPVWFRSVLGLRSDSDIVPEYAKYLAQLSRQEMRLFGRALEALIGSVRAGDSTGDAHGRLSRGLKLTIMLGKGLPAYSLVEMVRNESYPEGIRVLAAAALADYDEPVPAFWDELDLTRDRFLTPIFISAMAETDPRRAIETIKDEKAIPDESDRLFSPLRLAVSRLVATNDLRFALEVANRLPPVSRSILEEVMSLGEFRRSIDQARAESGPRVVGSVSTWKELCRGASESKRIRVWNPQYSQGKLFQGNHSRPEFVTDLVRELIREIKVELGLGDAEAIYPDWLFTTNLATQWRELLAWKLFCAEPAYKSIQRNDDIVAVGTLSQVGLVAHEQLLRQLHDELGIDQDGDLPPVGDVFGACVNRHITILHQPSTSVEDVLGAVSDWVFAQHETPSAAVKVEQPRKSTDSVEVPENISILLRKRKDEYVALLDWVTAQRLERQMSGKRHSSSFRATKLTFDEPMTVGYLFPKGQNEHGEHILNVVRRALFSSGTWSASFEKAMSDSLVVLAEQPSILRSDDSSEVLSLDTKTTEWRGNLRAALGSDKVNPSD